MASFIILCSCVAFGAIVIERPGILAWFRRLFHRKAGVSQMAALMPPRLRRDDGWTIIQCDDPDAFNDWLHRDEMGLPRMPGEEPSLGSHLLVELFGCDPDTLKEEGCVGLAMNEAAVKSNAQVVEQSFHEFKPYGVSGAVIIQESHYTIHTWPEHRYAAVDLFYCGGTVLVHRAVDVLREKFKPARIKFLVVRRGLQGEVER